ncbi:hypothetical protein [Rhodopila sp.]|uniref:hypothetical protein n=1 Tax=Rhodopila sp. TaxID=2480087 RepID=UPI003D11C730
METTKAMLKAARRAEFAYYHQNRFPGSRFVPIPDGMMLAILDAAIDAIGDDDLPDDDGPANSHDEAEVPRATRTTIVRARKPRTRR